MGLMDRGEDTAWERGWEGHHDQQLQRLARLPLAEKLRWLEQSHHLVQQLSNARTGDRPSEITEETTRPTRDSKRGSDSSPC